MLTLNLSLDLYSSRAAVVYSEYLVPALLRSIATVALASEGRLGDLVLAAPGGRPAARACVAFLANEIRCTATHELFCATAERYFRVKQLKKSRYHADSRDTSLHIFELRVRTDGHVSLSSGAPAPLMDLPGEVSYQLCVPFPPLVASAAAGGASASGATPCSEDFRSRVLVDSELDTLAAGDASAPAGSPSALLPQELRTASDPGSALLAAGPTSASLSEALATLALPMAAAVLCDALASASASDGSHGHGLFSQPPCEPPHVCATDSAASAGVTGSGSGSASGAEHRSLRDDIGSTSRSAGRIGARNPMHMRAAGLDRTMP